MNRVSVINRHRIATKGKSWRDMGARAWTQAHPCARTHAQKRVMLASYYNDLVQDEFKFTAGLPREDTHMHTHARAQKSSVLTSYYSELVQESRWMDIRRSSTNGRLAITSEGRSVKNLSLLGSDKKMRLSEAGQGGTRWRGEDEVIVWWD